MNNTKDWYEASYKNSGFRAQRRYPNEELLRFLGVNYFDENIVDRETIKVLEVGCGSCANLWMIAKEGFDAHGLDISIEALKLGKKMLNNWGVSVKLQQGNFLELPYKDNSFDVVIDVISMYCLNHQESFQGISEVHRVLKRNGMFFSYESSQNCSVFQNYLPAKMIDAHTLNGIYRKDSPFFGNHYSFHFWDKNDYREALINAGFSVEYLETIKKSYSTNESFEYLSVYSRKQV